jgi:cardiolipin synthase A/B
MQVLVQPGEGLASLLSSVEGARKSIEIVIFRFDEQTLELALAAAVRRGVFVHALIAYTNHGGEQNLRKLEARLLAAGVTVARTADDLVRYHAKLVIIDRRTLYLLTFNYTHLDIDHSRSFGVVIKSKPIVQEAVRLFEADTLRQPYTPAHNHFIVSPANARQQLSTFIQGAQKQLLIYDSKLTDREIIRILYDRAKAGVEIRVIGQLGKRGTNIQAIKLPKLRLHAQAIIRDGHAVFLGSQSLRKAELDDRREVGFITRDPQVVKQLLATFEADWSAANPLKELPAKEKEARPESLTVVLKEAVKEVVKEVVAEAALAEPPAVKEMKEIVKEAVKEALKETSKTPKTDS